MSTRPSRDQVNISIAIDISKRSTCARRDVGCILVDKYGKWLSDGYNGVPAEWDHCKDQPCPGANAESGTNLSDCEAIHAEQNALMRCPDITKIHTCYITDSPCVHCVKMFLNTACQRIVYLREYPHDSQKLWVKAGRDWIQIKHVET